MRKILAATVAVVSLAATSSPRAATITGSYSDWIAAVSGYSVTKNFEVADNSSVSSVTLTDGQILGITDGASIYSTPSSEPCCLTGFSGQVAEVDFSNQTFTFGPGVTALGFFVGTSALGKSLINVQLLDGSSSEISADFTSGDSSQFVGFYGGGSGAGSLSIAFTSQSIQQFAIANIVDSTVPEPMSISLLLAGLTGVTLARRRRV